MEAKYGGIEPGEPMRLRHPEDEDSRRKKLVAEVCLDREMPKAHLGEKTFL